MKKHLLTPVVLGLSWLISLAAVFVLGILLAFSMYLDPSATEDSADAPIVIREAVLVMERLSGTPMTIAEWDQLMSNEVNNEALEGAVGQLIAHRNPQERVHMTRKLAEALPMRQTAHVLRYASTLPESSQRNEVLNTFLGHWGGIDGRSALAFALAQRTSMARESGVLAVVRGWAQVAPRDVWTWIGSNSGGTRVDAFRRAEVIRVTCHTDLNLAFSLLIEMDESSDSGPGVRAFINYLLQTGTPARAMTWLQDLPRGPMRENALVELVSLWTADDPHSSLDWITALNTDESMFLLPIAGAIWGAIDPAPAVDWGRINLSGRALDLFLLKVGSVWIDREGPASLAGWLNRQGAVAEYDSLIKALAMATMEMDPLTALSWAKSIQAVAERQFVVSLVAHNWMRKDPVGAAQGLQSELTDPRLRRMLLEDRGRDTINQPPLAVVAPRALPVVQSPPQSNPLPAEVPDDLRDPLDEDDEYFDEFEIDEFELEEGEIPDEHDQ